VVSSNEPLLFSFRLSGGIAMSIHICPYCLNPVIYFERARELEVSDLPSRTYLRIKEAMMGIGNN